MRRLAAIAIAVASACAVRAPAPPASHPASPGAPRGRLAGPPPSLRAGVIAYPDVPALRAPDAAPAHHHHHHHAP